MNLEADGWELSLSSSGCSSPEVRCLLGHDETTLLWLELLVIMVNPIPLRC